IMIFEGGTHVWREIHMDGRPHLKSEAIKGANLARRLRWLLGRRYPRYRCGGLQRRDVARLLRAPPHGPNAYHRKVHASEQRYVALRSDNRRSRRIYEAMDRGLGYSVESNGRTSG